MLKKVAMLTDVATFELASFLLNDLLVNYIDDQDITTEVYKVKSILINKERGGGNATQK